ncbi:hypothetical protein [Dyadobacter psychrotolerans]|uniref:Uncharacterized protein n=1 Tax=Dyadobacter psychrotolerans TaxID=2541721 RepID=A0A4R5DRN1_9BACT|nr:hypothetical protein [Dyadobacter psychrotolerans]TDE13735.1 hypothetical protein E0F88_17705 [Dyadobacter psychrotolerans]
MRTNWLGNIFSPTLSLLMMNNFRLYAKAARILGFFTFFILGTLCQLFYREFFFRNNIQKFIYLAAILLFSMSFLFWEMAKGNTIPDLLRKSNDTIGILRIAAAFFFAIYVFLCIFLTNAEFLNLEHRYIFIYLAVGALSLSQVVKHKSDPDPSGKVNFTLYSLVLLVALYSIVKLFV